jgi:hypothetical protein
VTDGGRWKALVGVALIAGGVGLGVWAKRGEARARAEAALAHERAAAEAAAAETAKRAAEARAFEGTAARAAALRPLNNAINDHIDGTTLIDLFEHEDWWAPFRGDVASVRVIVGDGLLGAFGAIELGEADAEAVRGARSHGAASHRATIGGTEVLIAAARLTALPDKKPVIVLARRAPPAVAAALAPLPPVAPNLPVLGAAGGLVVVGLILAAMARRKAEPAAAVAAEIPREPTLKFGTPARPQPAANLVGQTSAARPPSAAGVSITVPGSAARASRASQPRAAATSAPGLAVPDAGVIAAELPRMDSGRTFGRYRLLDRLGEGGMSEVFTAVAQGVEGFSRTFVLKRLRPELAREREAVAQFIDEARLQAGLVHSNIVPVFDFGMVGNGEYFMTQEYIVGRDLLRLMSRLQSKGGTGLDPTVAYYVAHETLQALAHAHDHRDKDGLPMGIVHRDISPGNVMVSLRGEVKLADFGIVKAARRVSRTQVGMVKGNANFMSPEQARGQNVDQRSDLFSLAALMFYCLTGELLYGGENDLDVLYKAARGPTDEDQVRIAALSEPASWMLAKALSLDPNDRFQSAAEFADQLAAFIGGGKAKAAALMQQLFGEELRHKAA